MFFISFYCFRSLENYSSTVCFLDLERRPIHDVCWFGCEFGSFCNLSVYEFGSLRNLPVVERHCELHRTKMVSCES